MGKKGDKMENASSISAERIQKELAHLGDIHIRKMFGGHGIFMEDNSKFTVLIDPAHGGIDKGAIASIDISEKEIVLSLAKEIISASAGQQVKYVFTRKSDKAVSLEDRSTMAAKYKADLFISLHVNHAANKNFNGMEVYYSENNQQNKLSYEYALLFNKQISFSKNSSKPVQKNDFKVLVDTSCPALLINFGYLSNDSDLAFVSSTKNQREIAQQIVDIMNDIVKNQN